MMVLSLSSAARPRAERSCSASIWGKAGSPRRAKIWGIGRPADASMRSSRSTKRQASWRARSVPMVVLPEPIKPARQRIGTRGCGPRRGGEVVTRSQREKLVALQNANCTTVGGEFDFGEALSDGAEEALGEL